MSLSSLSSADLTKLIRLVKDKEILETKLSQIKTDIDSLMSGNKAVKLPSRKRSPRSNRRRSLKNLILKTLKSAGKAGASVKDLASKLKANPGSISVWFYTTGKRVKGLKKIAPARYAYLPE